MSKNNFKCIIHLFCYPSYIKSLLCDSRSAESETTSNRSLTSAKISEVKAAVKSLRSSANDNRKDIGEILTSYKILMGLGYQLPIIPGLI